MSSRRVSPLQEARKRVSIRAHTRRTKSGKLVRVKAHKTWVEKALVGEDLYRVGGAVRDELLGKSPKDIDYLVAGRDADEIKRLVAPAAKKVDDLEVAGRLVGVRVVDAEGNDFEIVPPRTEVSTGPGHQDFDIVADKTVSVRDDLARRDFTVNAIAQNVRTGEMVDPFGGIEDIRTKTLRTVSPEAFRDDPLRILRGLARVAKDDLEPDEETKRQMAEYAPNIANLSGERVQAELVKILSGDHAGKALRLARETGALQAMLPELRPVIGFEQESKYHDLTADEHIFSTIEAAIEQGAPMRVRLALLFHDAGKPESAWRGPKGNLHYYANPELGKEAHEEIGARIARAAMKRLRFDNKTIADVEKLVRGHMLQPTLKAKKIRELRGEYGELLDDLFRHRKADFSGKGEDPNPGHLEKLEDMWRLAREQEEAGEPANVRDLAINGGDLLALGFKKGPGIGKALQALLHFVVSDPALNDREWLLAQAGKLRRKLEESHIDLDSCDPDVVISESRTTVRTHLRKVKGKGTVRVKRHKRDIVGLDAIAAMTGPSGASKRQKKIAKRKQQPTAQPKPVGPQPTFVPTLGLSVRHPKIRKTGKIIEVKRGTAYDEVRVEWDNPGRRPPFEWFKVADLKLPRAKDGPTVKVSDMDDAKPLPPGTSTRLRPAGKQSKQGKGKFNHPDNPDPREFSAATRGGADIDAATVPVAEVRGAIVKFAVGNQGRWEYGVVINRSANRRHLRVAPLSYRGRIVEWVPVDRVVAAKKVDPQRQKEAWTKALRKQYPDNVKEEIRRARDGKPPRSPKAPKLERSDERSRLYEELDHLAVGDRVTWHSALPTARGGIGHRILDKNPDSPTFGEMIDAPSFVTHERMGFVIGRVEGQKDMLHVWDADQQEHIWVHYTRVVGHGKGYWDSIDLENELAHARKTADAQSKLRGRTRDLQMVASTQRAFEELRQFNDQFDREDRAPKDWGAKPDWADEWPPRHDHELAEPSEMRVGDEVLFAEKGKPGRVGHVIGNDPKRRVITVYSPTIATAAQHRLGLAEQEGRRRESEIEQKLRAAEAEQAAFEKPPSRADEAKANKRAREELADAKRRLRDAQKERRARAAALKKAKESATETNRILAPYDARIKRFSSEVKQAEALVADGGALRARRRREGAEDAKKRATALRKNLAAERKRNRDEQAAIKREMRSRGRDLTVEVPYDAVHHTLPQSVDDRILSVEDALADAPKAIREKALHDIRADRNERRLVVDPDGLSTWFRNPGFRPASVGMQPGLDNYPGAPTDRPIDTKVTTAQLNDAVRREGALQKKLDDGDQSVVDELDKVSEEVDALEERLRREKHANATFKRGGEVGVARRTLATGDFYDASPAEMGRMLDMLYAKEVDVDDDGHVAWDPARAAKKDKNRVKYKDQLLDALTRLPDSVLARLDIEDLGDIAEMAEKRRMWGAAERIDRIIERKPKRKTKRKVQEGAYLPDRHREWVDKRIRQRDRHQLVFERHFDANGNVTWKAKQALHKRYRWTTRRPESLVREAALADHAERELRLAGLFSSDSDYGGMLGTAVMDLIRAMEGQGHSGFSARLAVEIFEKLTRYEPLTPLSDNPAEWVYHDAEMFPPRGIWQSVRNPSAFSEDGGKTYYTLEDRSETFEEDGVTWTRGAPAEKWPPLRKSEPFRLEEASVGGYVRKSKTGKAIRVGAHARGGQSGKPKVTHSKTLRQMPLPLTKQEQDRQVEQLTAMLGRFRGNAVAEKEIKARLKRLKQVEKLAKALAVSIREASALYDQWSPDPHHAPLTEALPGIARIGSYTRRVKGRTVRVSAHRRHFDPAEVQAALGAHRKIEPRPVLKGPDSKLEVPPADLNSGYNADNIARKQYDWATGNPARIFGAMKAAGPTIQRKLAQLLTDDEIWDALEFWETERRATNWSYSDAVHGMHAEGELLHALQTRGLPFTRPSGEIFKPGPERNTVVSTPHPGSAPSGAVDKKVAAMDVGELHDLANDIFEAVEEQTGPLAGDQMKWNDLTKAEQHWNALAKVPDKVLFEFSDETLWDLANVGENNQWDEDFVARLDDLARYGLGVRTDPRLGRAGRILGSLLTLDGVDPDHPIQKERLRELNMLSARQLQQLRDERVGVTLTLSSLGELRRSHPVLRRCTIRSSAIGLYVPKSTHRFYGGDRHMESEVLAFTAQNYASDREVDSSNMMASVLLHEVGHALDDLGTFGPPGSGEPHWDRIKDWVRERETVNFTGQKITVEEPALRDYFRKEGRQHGGSEIIAEGFAWITKRGWKDTADFFLDDEFADWLAQAIEDHYPDAEIKEALRRLAGLAAPTIRPKPGEFWGHQDEMGIFWDGVGPYELLEPIA